MTYQNNGVFKKKYRAFYNQIDGLKRDVPLFIDHNC